MTQATEALSPPDIESAPPRPGDVAPDLREARSC